MQRVLVWPILLTTTLSFCAAGTQQRTDADKAKLTCKIWASSSLLPSGGGPIVHVSLTNGEDYAVTITALAGHLRPKNASQEGKVPERDRSYWSPIDVEKKSALKPVHDSKGVWTYPDGRIPLNVGQSVEFSLDLSVLEWADEVSSSLPSAKLFATVPSGTYEIYLGLEAQDKLGRFSVESSRATVEIQKSSTKPQ